MSNKKVEAFPDCCVHIVYMYVIHCQPTYTCIMRTGRWYEVPSAMCAIGDCVCVLMLVSNVLWPVILCHIANCGWNRTLFYSGDISDV